jgi:hypothetical protein
VKENVWYVWVDEEIVCSVCDCATLIKKGWRKRKLILIDEGEWVLKVRRVRCKECNRIHHILPDILVPYKRHCLETVEKIVQGNQEETFCGESDINRIKSWWRKMLLHIATLETAIKSLLPNPLESRLCKAVRVLANAHHWPGTRTALGSG